MERATTMGIDMNKQKKEFKPELVFAGIPKYVGGYRIGNELVFAFTKKPTRWHQFWCSFLIGWVWEDNEPGEF